MGRLSIARGVSPWRSVIKRGSPGRAKVTGLHMRHFRPSRAGSARSFFQGLATRRSKPLPTNGAAGSARSFTSRVLRPWLLTLAPSGAEPAQLQNAQTMYRQGIWKPISSVLIFARRSSEFCAAEEPAVGYHPFEGSSGDFLGVVR